MFTETEAQVILPDTTLYASCPDCGETTLWDEYDCEYFHLNDLQTCTAN